MSKRTAFICAFFILTSVMATGQTVDQVFLKNGSVIRGTITEIVPDGNITINDLSGNTWVYSMQDVERIAKPAADKNSQPGEIKTYKEKRSTGEKQPRGAGLPGIVNMTTIGFLPGSQSSQYRAPFSVQTSIGYKTSFGMYSGLLVGLEFLNINHIPLMADLQYHFGIGDVRPVFIARGGYALPSKTSSDNYGTQYSYRGGITGSAGMGLKITTRDRFAWDVSLLYRYMEINYVEEYEWQDFPNTYKDVYNRLEIRLGFYLGN